MYPQNADQAAWVWLNVTKQLLKDMREAFAKTDDLKNPDGFCVKIDQWMEGFEELWKAAEEEEAKKLGGFKK